jgi:hypothetical protein
MDTADAWEGGGRLHLVVHRSTGPVSARGDGLIWVTSPPPPVHYPSSWSSVILQA